MLDIVHPDEICYHYPCHVFFELSDPFDGDLDSDYADDADTGNISKA